MVELLDINTTAACDHVGEIERGIRWLKERMRSVVRTLSTAGIRYLYKQIFIHILYYVTTFVNTIPTNLGVSSTYSPCEIVTQHKLNIKRDCKVQFRARS